MSNLFCHLFLSFILSFMISLVCAAVRSLVGNVGVIAENVGQQFWSKCAGSVSACNKNNDLLFFFDECID